MHLLLARPTAKEPRYCNWELPDKGSFVGVGGGNLVERHNNKKEAVAVLTERLAPQPLRSHLLELNPCPSPIRFINRFLTSVK